MAAQTIDQANRSEAQLAPFATELSQRLHSVKEQHNSQLCSKLPYEIRTLVWQSVFAWPLREIGKRAEKGEILEQRRPLNGHINIFDLDTALLLTCKAVYLEAWWLPIASRPLIGYHSDRQHPTSLKRRIPGGSFFAPWHLAAMSRIELATQQMSLEGGLLRRYASYMSTIERHGGIQITRNALSAHSSLIEREAGRRRDQPWKRLQEVPEESTMAVPNPIAGKPFIARRITQLAIHLGHMDWWNWQKPEAAISLEPGVRSKICGCGTMHRGQQHMLEERDKRVSGIWSNFRDWEGWGHQISLFPDLELLEIHMEFWRDRQAELEQVAECAALWTFPSRDDQHELRLRKMLPVSFWSNESGSEQYVLRTVQFQRHRKSKS